jgi:hypothetical protein
MWQLGVPIRRSGLLFSQSSKARRFAYLALKPHTVPIHVRWTYQSAESVKATPQTPNPPNPEPRTQNFERRTVNGER